MGGDGRSRGKDDDLNNAGAGAPEEPEPEQGGTNGTFAGLLAAVPTPKARRPEPPGLRRVPGVVPPRPAAPAVASPPRPEAPPAAPVDEPFGEPPAPVLGFPGVDDENPLGATTALPLAEIDLGEVEPTREPVAREPFQRPGMSFESIVPAAGVPDAESAGETSPRGRSARWVLWLLLAAVVAGAGVVSFLFRDRLLPLVGLGGPGSLGVAAGSGDVEPLPTTPAAPVPEPTPLEGTSVEPTPAAAAVPTEAPAPVPTPTAPPAPEEPVPAGPATRVQSLSWQGDAATGLVLVVRTNGALPASRVNRIRLEAPPREVLRVSGIVSPTDQEVVRGDGALVTQVRVGHHPEKSPPELHLVVDLASPAAHVTGLESAGASLRVSFGALPR